ncbi:MAG TPA: DUF192 domain-containing protein [bacterium]
METRRRGRERARALGGAAAAALLVALAGSRAAAQPAAQPAAPPADRRPVCVRGNCFDAEIAVTAEERSRGLMHRTTLAPGAGMLFVFPAAGRHGFWMKNTLIELDIVFIGADKRVVDIARRAQPCRKEPCAEYYPGAPAAYALEIAGGLADRYGLGAGDPVEFR